MTGPKFFEEALGSLKDTPRSQDKNFGASFRPPSILTTNLSFQF